MSEDCPFRGKPVVKYVGRYFPINLGSCPTCGRNENSDFPEKVRLIEGALHKANRPDLHVMALNCIVNGVGECKGADVGVLFGKGKAAIYKRGEIVATVLTEEVTKKFLEVVESTW